MSDTQDDAKMLANLDMLLNFEMLEDDGTSVEELEKLDDADKGQTDEGGAK